MNTHRTRAVLQSVSLLALGSALLLSPAVASATDADIPRVEAGAEHGSVRSQLELGNAYFVGRGVERNEQQAAYWFEKAAKAGDPVAQLQIGYFYQVGIGVSRDEARAAHWYQLAAAGGLASAKLNLGVAYMWGIGVPKNTDLALKLFREAVNKGCGQAAGYLGDAYYFGVGVPKDIASSEHWFAEGAKMHDPRSQFRLAGLLSTGAVPKQDLHKASELLRESVAAGFVPARHALGLLIVNHPELAASPNEALQLLQEAASEGVWKSSAVLGTLARDGRGVPADSQQAYLHFRIAQYQGGEDARLVVSNDLSILSGKLSHDQMASLDRDAADWVAKHPKQLEFVYKTGSGPDANAAFALTTPSFDIHAGRLMPNPD